MHDLFTDEDLAAKAQQGDERAGEALLSRYRKACKAIARAFPIQGHDTEDIYSMTLIGFTKALYAYRPGCGTKYGTFVRRLIGRTLVDEYRTANKQGAIPPEILANLNETLSLDGGEAVTLEDAISAPVHVAINPAEIVGREDVIADLLMRSWPPFRDLIKGIDSDMVVRRNGITDSALVSIVNAIKAVSRQSEHWPELRSLLLESYDQPPLFGGVGTKEAHGIAKAVFQEFLTVEKNIVADLIEGLTFDEVATRRNLTPHIVTLIYKALREVAACEVEDDDLAVAA